MCRINHLFISRSNLQARETECHCKSVLVYGKPLQKCQLLSSNLPVAHGWLLSRDSPISKTSLSYGINFFWTRLLQQKRRLLVAKVHTPIKASSLKRLKTFSTEIVYCELKFLKTEFSYSVTHTCLGQIRECPWETSQASELFKADLILILG